MGADRNRPFSSKALSHSLSLSLSSHQTRYRDQLLFSYIYAFWRRRDSEKKKESVAYRSIVIGDIGKLGRLMPSSGSPQPPNIHFSLSSLYTFLMWQGLVGAAFSSFLPPRLILIDGRRRSWSLSRPRLGAFCEQDVRFG